MIQSLLVKLGMLVVTMGVVFWIGWQAPEAPEKNAASEPETEAAPPSAATSPGAENETGDQSVHNVIAAKSPAAAKVMRSETPRRELLDLNRASAEDLESLPGIGAVLAQRMIAYRTSIGRFHAIEELREVKGIGSKKFDRIRLLVTVAVSSSKGKAEKHPS